MESLTLSVEALQEANAKLERLLATMRPHQPFLVTPEHISAALRELVRVGEWQRAGLAKEADEQTVKELERYRSRVEQLGKLLPDLHARLLTERSRLEGEREHLEAAAAWAHSTQRSK